MPEATGNGEVQEANRTTLPKIKPIFGFGIEYSKALESVWEEFAEIRKDVFYASDENKVCPRFSPDFALHEYKAKWHTKDIKDGRFSKTIYTQISQVPSIKRICKSGILTPDIEFEDEQKAYDGIEEETPGAANFFIAGNQKYEKVTDLINALARIQTGDAYVTSSNPDSASSSTLMFAFDTSRPGLRPLMQYAMIDNQNPNSLWANQFDIDNGKRMRFPLFSGNHLAMPIGLPANYIEYIVANEQSPYWHEGRLQDLQAAAVCDGHKIPFVSIHTGKVIPDKSD